MRYAREISDWILDTDDYRFSSWSNHGWRLVAVVAVPSDKYLNSYTYHYYWEKTE